MLEGWNVLFPSFSKISAELFAVWTLAANFEPIWKKNKLMSKFSFTQKLNNMPFLKDSHQKKVLLIFYHFCLKSHNCVILCYLIMCYLIISYGVHGKLTFKILLFFWDCKVNNSLHQNKKGSSPFYHKKYFW